MDINEKIKLSQHNNSIHFFKQGIFAQLFGVSLYLAITELKLSVKVCGVRYKKFHNSLILRAGLPIAALEKRYSNFLITREYGYEFMGNWLFDNEHYQAWKNIQLAELLKQVSKQQSLKPQCKKFIINQQSSKLNHDGTLELADKVSFDTWQLTLSEQEYQFLKNWQPDKYPASLESGFIRGLSKKISSQSA